MSARRYSSAVVAEARELYANEWTPYQIARIFRARGIDVSDSTVVYWCDERAAERKRRQQRENARERRRRARDERLGNGGGWLHSDATPEYRMARLRALAEARLSAASIAKVLRIDFGDKIGPEAVRRVLETGEMPRPWRALNNQKAAA